MLPARYHPPAAMDVALNELLEPFEAGGLWDAGPVEPLESAALPAPYRSLLDHQRDMTGTLEGFFGGPIALRPLEMRCEGGLCLRRVVLEKEGRPVEYGAIRIHLDPFTPRARERILAGSVPLGAILRDEGVDHHCRARGFFAVAAERLLPAGFVTAGAERLFGRVALLSNAAGDVLAEVVEVLPPVVGKGARP